MCILYGGSLHHCKSLGKDSWLLDNIHMGYDCLLSPRKTVIMLFLCVFVHLALCLGVDFEEFFMKEE